MTINSSTDICNLALDLLSVENIEDIENPSNATEEILNRWYVQSRKKLLREHPWNFAVKRIILAADTQDPAFAYEAQFSVPSDFVRLCYISTDLTVDEEYILPQHAFQFENNKILLTEYYGDATSVRLVYVADVTTVSQYDPMFIDLLAHEIALSVAYKLTESNTNIDRINALKSERSRMAKAIDGQERPPQKIERSRMLSARRRAGRTHRTDRIIF